MSQLMSRTLKGNVNLHLIMEEKFKTNLIKVYFQRPLLDKEVTYNALLPMVLQRGTLNYDTSKKLSKKLEDLYGAYLDGNIFKKGEKQIIEFSLGTADLRYIEDKSLLRNSVKLLNELINQPVLEGDCFRNQYVQQEINNLSNRIQARVNDKNNYAVERCLEEMCSEEPFKLHELGKLEDLKTIGAENLYKHYENILKTSPVDIVAIGNLEIDSLAALFEEELMLSKGNTIQIEREKIDFQPKDLKNIKEAMDVNQGKLSIGFRTNIPFESPEYPALMVYTNLLGGGAHSKLFLKVREERSLCYYIYSRLEKFKSIMYISCGIEVDKYNEAIEVIKQQLDAIQKGDVSDQELEVTKKAMINSVKGMADNNNALVDYYHSQILGKQIVTPSEIIERIQRVSKEEVIAIADKIKMDTVYFLSNEK